MLVLLAEVVIEWLELEICDSFKIKVCRLTW